MAQGAGDFKSDARATRELIQMKRSARKRNGVPRRSPPAKSQDARRRALDALSLMRSKNLSLARAAKEALTTTRTMTKYVASALQKKASGRYKAKSSDRLLRSLRF